MFRCHNEALQPDPSFEPDLKKLGYFINKIGQVRKIEAPSEPYRFYATNNERVNEVLREAMQVCEREEVNKRLEALGIKRVYLPEFSTVKPTGPHIPILAPPVHILKQRKRIIVLVNDSSQDLGILAYRQLQYDLGINGGSVINFAKEIISRSAVDEVTDSHPSVFDDGFKIAQDDNAPALIVMNTGQLLYSHKFNKSMTIRSWSAMPRKSSAHDMVRIHEQENRVTGHRTPKEHVQSVFEDVLCNPDRVAPDAEIYMIGIESGAEDIINVMTENFEKYGSRITAMALIHSLVDDITVKNPVTRAFLRQRTRQWRFCESTFDPNRCTDLPKDYEQDFRSESPQHDVAATKTVSWFENVTRPSVLAQITNKLHELLLNPLPLDMNTTSVETGENTEWTISQAVLCPTFAGGMNTVGECVFTDQAVQQAILSFFEEVAQDPTHYRNPNFKLHDEAPQPTPEAPLPLSADEYDLSSLPPEMTPEQYELDDARQTLSDMRTALEACPENVQELEKGREKLIKKIQVKEATIEEMEKKALGNGGLKADEATEKRENWKPHKEGKKVAFAGTVVDSELLKAAGLMDTANEELAKLEDEEKAFI